MSKFSSTHSIIILLAVFILVSSTPSVSAANDFYASSALDKQLAQGCQLLSSVYTVRNNGDLSSVISRFATQGSRVSFLLSGRNYFLEKDLKFQFNNMAFSICGLNTNNFPRLFFNSQGEVQGGCIDAQPHSLFFETTGLRIERVHLVFQLPQPVDGLTHVTQRADCSSEATCEETYGFFLRQSAVTITGLEGESSSAMTIVHGGRNDDNQIFQFESVYIEHSAGTGAAIRQAKSMGLKYKNINMNITGEGTGIRRSAYPGSSNNLDSIFYLFDAAATGVEATGERPVWMSFEIPTHSFFDRICLAGTWKQGNALEMQDFPRTNEQSHKQFANGVCAFPSNKRLFWRSTDSGTPFNASRIDAEGCEGNHPLDYQQASQCPFQPFVYAALANAAGPQNGAQGELGSGIDFESIVDFPFCERRRSSSMIYSPGSSVASVTGSMVMSSPSSSVASGTSSTVISAPGSSVESEMDSTEIPVTRVSTYTAIPSSSNLQEASISPAESVAFSSFTTESRFSSHYHVSATPSTTDGLLLMPYSSPDPSPFEAFESDQSCALPMSSLSYFIPVIIAENLGNLRITSNLLPFLNRVRSRTEIRGLNPLFV